MFVLKFVPGELTDFRNFSLTEGCILSSGRAKLKSLR